MDGFLALHATHSSCTTRAPSGTYWDGSACNSLTHWRLWGVCCRRGELGAEEAPGAVKAQGLCASPTPPSPHPHRVKVCGPQEENGPHTKASDQEGHFPFVLTLVRIWPQRGAWTRRIDESPAARPGEQQGQAAGPVCPTPGVAGAEPPRQECAQCAQRAGEGAGRRRQPGALAPSEFQALSMGWVRSGPLASRSRQRAALGRLSEEAVAWRPARPRRCLCPGRRPPSLSSVPASCTHTSRLRTGRSSGQSHCRPHLLPRSWRER